MADKKMELIVNVNVSSAGSPVAASSVNTVGIIVEDAVVDASKVPENNEYADTDLVKEVFGENSEAYAMAGKLFAQDTHPASVYIVRVAEKTKAAIEAAIGAASLDDVYHWVLSFPVSSVSGGTESVTDEDKVNALQMVKDLSDYGAANFKMFHMEICTGAATASVASDKESAVKALFLGFKTDEGQETEQVYVGLNEYKSRRCAVYAHPTATDHVGVCAVADRCGVDPARGTWAHKELTGVSPATLSRTQFKNALDAGYNVYTSIARSPRVFLGTTCGPNDFIDTIVKADWLKFRIQEAVFALLQTGNEGYGIDLSDDGIVAVGAVVSDVLNTAFKNHYIMDGYSLTLPKYAEIPVADKNVRRLSGIRASVKLMDSVHSVVSIDITAEANK